MSYILEALQEAQKNRDDGRVPTLRTVQAEPAVAPKRAKNWLMPLGVLVILGLVGVAVYQWFGRGPEPAAVPDSELASAVTADTAAARTVVQQSEANTQPSTSDVAQVAPASAVAGQPAAEQPAVGQKVTEQSPQVARVEAPPVQPPVTATPAVSAPPKGSVAPARETETSKDAAVASIQASSTAGTNKTVETSPVASSAGIQSSVAPDVASAPAPSTPGVTPQTIPAPTKELEKELAAVTPSPTQSDGLNKAPSLASPVATKIDAEITRTAPIPGSARDTTPVPTVSATEVSSYVIPESEVAQAEAVADQDLIEEVPQAQQIPHYRELPYEIQQSLPGISYSVHLYAAEPSHRMVKIDGRVRREGDTIKPGLVLEEITPTGAVFSYRDNVFRVPVNG